MNLENLNQVLKDEPKYRWKQVEELVYQKAITQWEQATNLSKKLRADLKKDCSLEINAKEFRAKDKQTIKALITLNDGKKVETVLMRHQDQRNTVCVSSQIGCPMGCAFCATGQMGFERNLTAQEIVEQVLYFKRKYTVSNIVFMGMGEPFLNYDNVLTAIRILNDKQKFNIGARKISVSTCGIIEGIKKFTKENLQVNLALSLHAPNNELRDHLMPINKRFNLKKVLSAINDYIETTRRQVMLEYVMLAGINDQTEHAKELAKLLREHLDELYLVNIISYNETGKFQASTQEAIDIFLKMLKQANIPATQRYSFGQDVAAACGQLAGERK